MTLLFPVNVTGFEWLFFYFQPVSIHTGKIEWAGRPEVGDCSLKVHNVDIAFDDGEWACQVAPSIWQAKDALSSKPAKLVVRGETTLD